MQRLDYVEAVRFLFEALHGAHEREPFVGGLFNAYEAAVHYELFNAALARRLDETLQEESLGKGQTSCDLVFPLSNDDWLWVEVKMWWFLHQAYNSPYVMLGKTHDWPLIDWERLEYPPKGRQRALLLVRTWDDAAAKKKADEWRDGLIRLMAERGAPASPLVLALKERTYPGPKEHTRSGDVLLWCSCPTVSSPST
jgi:hypothetical protein